MQFATSDVRLCAYVIDFAHLCEGRSINKLQNSAILLIYQIYKKIRNIHFLRNLILNMISKFYYDDVTVTSFIILNMATLPLKSSRNEQRAAIRFLWAK